MYRTRVIGESSLMKSNLSVIGLVFLSCIIRDHDADIGVASLAFAPHPRVYSLCGGSNSTSLLMRLHNATITSSTDVDVGFPS